MSKPRFVDMGDLEETASTDPVEVSGLESFSVTVGGTFVGTYSIEVSMDGTTFVVHPSASAKTAPFVLDIAANTYKQVQVTCSAYTSGTIKCLLGGRDADLRG